MQDGTDAMIVSNNICTSKYQGVNNSTAEQKTSIFYKYCIHDVRLISQIAIMLECLVSKPQRGVKQEQSIGEQWYVCPNIITTFTVNEIASAAFINVNTDVSPINGRVLYDKIDPVHYQCMTKSINNCVSYAGITL